MKPPRTPTPHVIAPTAVYTATQARDALGLRPSTIKNEVALGRLRVSKRAGRYFFLGSWLLEWITSGEKTSRRRRRAVDSSASPATEG